MYILLREGNQKIQFKRAEIAQLQRYRGSKRLDTGRLSPAPKTRGLFSKKKKTTKPASKYNPYAEDKVSKGTEPTGMFSMDDMNYNRANPEARSTAWAEDDRAGMTSQSNQRSSGSKPPTTTNARSSLNQKGYSPANYYSRFLENYETNRGKRPSSKTMGAMRKDAERLWNANAPLPKLVTKKTVKDNPHSFDYGTSYSAVEKAYSFNAAKKHKGRYYGPKYRKSLGVKRPSTTNKKKWDDWNEANNISGFGGMPDFMTRQRARANRETALMRKRAGAKVRFDNPSMTNATQMRSWETYAKPEEVAMIKAMLPKMTGLEKFPELTPEGNAMMIELVSVGTDPQKMQMAANKLATDLVNKSGYFVKKYNVEVDPMQSKVKVSEMSGFAGGLTKTRNSMQRLLK